MIYPDEDICKSPIPVSRAPASVDAITDKTRPAVFSGPVLQEGGNKNPLPTWRLEVNSTDPIFFYW